MNIPDTVTCIRLMDEYKMLNNIRRHSLVVARVADTLVTGLENKSERVPVPNRSLVLAGALLHDIAKTPCLDGSCDHAGTGAAICRQHGYRAVAKIVKEHVILKDHNPDRYRSGLFTAREIVYYADKRVRHDQIVSLEQRLTYILKHYGNNDPHRHRLIRDNFQLCLELEEALFTLLPFAADELEHRVRCPQIPTKKET
jgi:putative nucleotidyltransferase with HDIG domain